MKIKLTPQIAYIAGITKYIGVRDGIGIRGNDAQLQAFAQAIMQAQLTTADKMIAKEQMIRFFHSAYATYLKQIKKEAVDKFKHHNDYAAAYLAGIFDAVGVIGENRIALRRCDFADDAIFENLGFGIKKERGVLLIGHAEQFLKFVKQFRKVDDIELQVAKRIAD